MPKHILSVDSSQSFAKFVEVIIKRLGFSILSARSAGDGLQILEGRIPDLIFTEAILPDMDGLEFIKAIRNNSRTSRIPVIVITVDSRFSEQFRGKNPPYSAFLTKPVSVKSIYDILQAHLSYLKDRKHLRAPIAARVSLKDGTQYRSYLTNSVGEGGMFIEMEEPQDVGEVIEITLLLPGLIQPLSVKGAVVYSFKKRDGRKVDGMGIRFVELSHQHHEILSNYIQSYLSDTLPRTSEAARKVVRERVGGS